MALRQNRFQLPDPLMGTGARRGQRTTITTSGPKGSRVGVSPSEFLTAVNEDRGEDESEITRDSLPEGFSIGGGAKGGRESVRYQALPVWPTPRSGPEPPPSVPTPQNRSEELESAGDEQRKNRLRGRASTILTGGQGLLSGPGQGSLRIRTLMGA